MKNRSKIWEYLRVAREEAWEKAKNQWGRQKEAEEIKYYLKKSTPHTPANTPSPRIGTNYVKIRSLSPIKNNTKACKPTRQSSRTITYLFTASWWGSRRPWHGEGRITKRCNLQHPSLNKGEQNPKEHFSKKSKLFHTWPWTTWLSAGSNPLPQSNTSLPSNITQL